MSGACQHNWHFVQGLTARLRCTRCGQMTWPKDAEQKVQEVLQDVHSCSYYCDRPECIKAQRDELRERLAQPEQGPVVKWDASAPLVVHPHPAFQATPPQRKPLTDDEIEEVFFDMGQFAKIDLKAFARAIEAAHGIKGEA